MSVGIVGTENLGAEQLHRNNPWSGEQAACA